MGTNQNSQSIGKPQIQRIGAGLKPQVRQREKGGANYSDNSCNPGIYHMSIEIPSHPV